MRIVKSVWVPFAALFGITTALVGLARSETSATSIKIWDAALYDSEDCRPGQDVELACPLYTMRVQGKAFTADIQNECDRQLSAAGVSTCAITVDMKSFRENWGVRDPSLHHRKSMWIDYECNPGALGSKRIRAFGEEVTNAAQAGRIRMACD